VVASSWVAGGGKIARKMSFTSAACAEGKDEEEEEEAKESWGYPSLTPSSSSSSSPTGAFPEDANMAPSIINTPLLFTEAPTKAAVCETLSPFVNYER